MRTRCHSADHVVFVDILSTRQVASKRGTTILPSGCTRCPCRHQCRLHHVKRQSHLAKCCPEGRLKSAAAPARQPHSLIATRSFPICLNCEDPSVTGRKPNVTTPSLLTCVGQTAWLNLVDAPFLRGQLRPDHVLFPQLDRNRPSRVIAPPSYLRPAVPNDRIHSLPACIIPKRLADHLSLSC